MSHHFKSDSRKQSSDEETPQATPRHHDAPQAVPLKRSLLIAFASVLVALLCGEALARWYFPDVRTGPQQSSLRLSRARPSDPPPSAPHHSSTQGPRERPLHYYLPNVGMNTQDFAYTKEKPPATFRIAVVGDSFSYAPKMQFDDSFSKRLERYLNLNAPRDGQNSVGKSTEGFNRAEVINFSVPGLNTAQEVEVVRQALTYNPDLVLLQITLNDPQLRPLNLEPPEVQQKYGRLPLDLNSSFITRHSALARLIWTRLHNQATIGNYIEYHRQLFAPGESRDRFLTAIDRINSISRSSDTSPGLVAVLFPLFDFPLDQSYPFAQIHKALSQEFKDRKIPLLDLFSAFRGIPTVRLQLIPGIDSHPNEIAHRIAAERILRWLAKRNLVPRSLAPSRVVNQRDNVKEPLARRSSRSKAQRSDKNQSATPVERKDF